MNKTTELAYWINEREFMRMKKEDEIPEVNSDPPYSRDPAMANVRYCNVHRENDKVTRWVAKNWRDPNATSHLLTLGMVAARMINWPDTLEVLGFPHSDLYRWLERGRHVIRTRQGQGLKSWTSAYTISTCGRPMLKEDYVFDHVLREVASRVWEYPSGNITLADSFVRLTSVDGLGSFLAAQVIADLKNTPGHPLSRAPDFWTWSAPGPGSLRGLEAYFGRKSTPSRYHADIELCYNEVLPHIHPYVKRIHMQDFQNCLCEFSKFIRVKEGDGRVRNKYIPG